VKKWLVVPLLILAAIVLGATVFREPVAWAAQSVDATILGPLDNGNVRTHEEGTANTREQNTDSNGNIKVHEQGTANVRVANRSFPVFEEEATRSFQSGFQAGEGGIDSKDLAPIRASLITIDWDSASDNALLTLGSSTGVVRLTLRPQGGTREILPLTQPILVDAITLECFVASPDCGAYVNLVGS